MYAKDQEDEKLGYSEVKKAEKMYRSYGGKNKLETLEIVDFNSPTFDAAKYKITEKQVDKYKVYYLDYPQGAFVVKNYMSVESMLNVTMKCLNEYVQKPNRTNLYIYDGNYTEKDGTVPRDYDPERFMVRDHSRFYFNKKIRWANVGYQYDWNERRYPSGQTSIPDEMRKVAQDAANLFGFAGYDPESIIINYYDSKNYMGCHLDDGEIDQVSPILSFQMGLSAIFLIGGPTKDIKPIALRLDSGDLIVMSGFSRTCYHGVPRIIENSFDRKPFDEYLKSVDPEIFKKYEEKGQAIVKPEKELLPNGPIHAVNYLTESRLNFNFRQVYVKKKEEEEMMKKQEDPEKQSH